jgi:outer membrane protein OmpU
MDNLKKVGLSALAGSLVAFSAATAGEMTVTGSAKFTYTADTGNEDSDGEHFDNSRWGMNQALAATGSAELDNGHTVTLMHAFSTNGGAKSTSVLTYDMGSMGTLRYQEDSGALGIGIIDDITPTADEEVWNGLGTGAASGGDLVGRVSGGVTGFNYNISLDMVDVNIGYSPNSQSGSQADGSNGTTGGLESSKSVAISITPMDGLRIVAGTGQKGNADGLKSDDHDTIGATYAWGPVTVGYQHSEIDDGTTGTTKDTKQDMMSIAFAVNDDLSISYGSQDTSRQGQSIDQEVTGWSVGYSMGGITIKAHRNTAENINQTANNESEHTEIALTFAF